MRKLAAGLVSLLTLPFLLLLLLFALAAAVLGALTGDQPNVAAGPVYYASQVNLTGSGEQALHLATVHDAGFGNSDAARIDNMVSKLRPNSPLVGQGAHMIVVGQQWRVDPLLIAFWQLESEMATTGINSPTNGGNMTWAAALEASQQYGCTPGPSSLGHHWAKCPNVPSGLSLWFDYMGSYYQSFPDLDAVVNRYNPCSDPGNIANGFPCGTNYGNLILGVIRTYAGPPVVESAPGPGSGAVAAFTLMVPGYWTEPSGEFGEPRSITGAPHTGLDLMQQEGAPIYFAEGGSIEWSGWDYLGGYGLILHDDRKRKWYMGHFKVPTKHRVGERVERGEYVAPVGRTGADAGPKPHLHFSVTWPGTRSPWANPREVLSNWDGGYQLQGECPPEVTISASVGGVVWAKTDQGKRLQPGVPQILNTVLGRTDYSVYQGWGPADFPGEPSYTYQGRRYPLFHMGYDLNYKGDFGGPLYSPDDAVATKVVFSDGNLVEVLTLSTGYRWQLLHLSRQVASGQVKRGQLVGYIGSTGNSSGPHLHIELKPPGKGRAWVPPEQWVCRLR